MATGLTQEVSDGPAASVRQMSARSACTRTDTHCRWKDAHRKSREREPTFIEIRPIRSATTVTAPVAFCT